MKINVTLRLSDERILRLKEAAAVNAFVIHDENLTVPNDGRQRVQVLWDFDIYGMSRQERNQIRSNFDHPQLANGDYGLRRRHPGFNGTEYNYVTLTDGYYYLMYDLIKWAANHRLEEGRVDHWVEKVSNRPTRRKSYTLPVRQANDGGWFAEVTPMTSYLWAYIQLTMKGKSNTDAGSREYGMWDPITKLNPDRAGYQWLHGIFAGALIEATSLGAYWQFPCIDSTKPAPSLDEVLSKGLYHWANAVSRMRLPNGRNMVSDFPCVAEPLRALGLPSVGTPMLTLGRGPFMWIKKSSCSAVLMPGSAWSPYRKLW